MAEKRRRGQLGGAEARRAVGGAALPWGRARPAQVMSGALVLAAVLATHYGYSQWPTLGEQQWHYYVATHATLALVLLLLLPQAQRSRLAHVGVFACWLGAVESVQASGCAVIEWGQLVESELCVQAFGPEFFYALASTSLAAAAMLAVQRWRGRRHA